MSHVFHRLSYRIRWQIFARVLPVMVVAVLTIGALSWVVFAQHATGRTKWIEKKEVSSLMENLRRRASLESMAIEVRQHDFLSRGGRADGAPLVEDLLQMELLDGVALGRPGTAEGYAPGLFSLVDSLSTENNLEAIAAWLVKYNHCFQPGFRSGSWTKVRVSDGPVLVESNPGHPVYLFPPLLLESTWGNSTTRLALLPVLVRDENREHLTGHPVYFLDLKSLVEDFQPTGWWCVLDAEGTVLVAADGSAEVGSRLADMPSNGGDDVLGVASGADLIQALGPGENIRTAVVGRRFLPWIVTAGRGKDMPFALMTAQEVSGLRAMSTNYVLAVFAVVLLALGISLFGVTRVVEKISRHLAHVATSKDEAHRLVQLKAENLRGTLDDMRMLDKAKDDFLILISHEVRTPLTSIMGGVDILKSSVAQVKGPEKETLDRLNVLEIASIIESSGQRLTGFMNDAIQMTSIQSRDRKLELQPVPAADLVEIGLCGVRERAHMRGISLVNELENGAHWSVLCDQKVLKVAFEKILNNAVVHNFDGGQIIIREAKKVPGHAKADYGVEPEGEYILKGQASFRQWEHEKLTWRLIEVFNTGDPIPEDRRKALFGKFEVVGRIEHHHKGSGLSIPIASSAVKNHGGRILVHADKKMGNSFFLLVPTVREGAVARPTRLSDRGNQVTQGVGGGAGDEKIGQMADPAGFEVELDDAGTIPAGGSNQSGSGVDGPCGAYDEEELTVGSGIR